MKLSVEQEELCRFLAERRGFGDVDPSCRMEPPLVDDSLDFLDLICDVETEFEKKIPKATYGQIKTVADLGKILFEVPS